ncbi:alpha/beta-hydrolase [Saccharata proteae CBS 121410]|uniref:Alpha/beta-hydrolase n=1 Tax=Saccharata proteae CBS 121410 TaxID=1314787 RepID=A0A9P4HZ01_9PEZI|nr:alpha/beta-hydrolase [Saccharata proteae CBS 121410]
MTTSKHVKAKDPLFLYSFGPRSVDLPIENEEPEYLSEHRQRYRSGRLYTYPRPCEWSNYGRAIFLTDQVKTTEQVCPVRGGEITVKVFEPVRPFPRSTVKRPAFMNFHGGGWVFGGLHSDENFCTILAHRLGCVAFDVHYRTYSDSKHPTQVEDCWTAFQWLRTQKVAEFGLDSVRLSVGGPTAGGHLASVVAAKCKELEIPLAFKLLQVPERDLDVFSPTGELDPAGSFESYNNRQQFLRGSAWFRTWVYHWHPDMMPPASSVSPALVIMAATEALHGECEMLDIGTPDFAWTRQPWPITGDPPTIVHVDCVRHGKEFNEAVLERLGRALKPASVPAT